MANSTGQMEPTMMGSGRTIRQMGQVESFIAMERYMKVNSVMTNHMDTECTYLLMVPSMKVNGTKIIRYHD